MSLSYFSPCEECGVHGHIVCGGGKRSVEFGTISRGLQVLTELVRLGEIMEDEEADLKRQITESELEPADAEGDQIMDILLRVCGGSEQDLRGLFDEIHGAMRLELASGNDPNRKKGLFQ